MRLSAFITSREAAIQSGNQSQLKAVLEQAPDWISVDLWRMRNDDSIPPETEETRAGRLVRG